MDSLPSPRPAGNVVLYHTTPASRLPSILRDGILPACSRGARRESWYHTPGRLGWALEHVRERHGSERVVSLRVLVPRAWLTRRKAGVWTCNRRLTPAHVQAINIVGL